MSAKVAFLSRPVPADEKKPVTAIQPAAVVERGGHKVVFVVKDDKAQQTQVRTGRKIGELVEVQGIRAGDKVVLNPGEKLKDGSTVSPAKK